MEKMLGKYEILEELGCGSFGGVFLAKDTNLNNNVAIKKVSIDENAVERRENVKKEMELLLNLKHPGLPQIFDFIEEEDASYIVMEYVEGISLYDYISEHGKVDTENAVRWIKELCEILEYMHDGRPAIIYRDLKPANVMITKDGKIKLVDFGAAFVRDYATETKDILGTRGYTAPELFMGKQAEKTSDIYSLGVILYEMLTGINPNRPPYLTKSLRQVDRSFSKELERIVNKCINKDPGQRYQSVESLKKEIDKLDKIMDFESLFFKIKKFTVLMAYIVAGLSIFEPFYTVGYENLEIADVERMLLLMAVALLLNILIVYVSPAISRPVKIEKQIWLTGKNYVGLYGLIIGLSITMGGVVFINSSSTKAIVPDSLWVEMKDVNERKMLLQSDASYTVEDMVRLEIPSEEIPSESMNLKIVATDSEGKIYESRIFSVHK